MHVTGINACILVKLSSLRFSAKYIIICLSLSLTGGDLERLVRKTEGKMFVR